MMYIFPVKYLKITQGYHQKYGIDMGYNSNYYGKNQNIHAVNDGTVLKIVKQTKGGNVIYIKHDDGYISEYAHLKDNSITVNVNDRVSSNQVIAKMGNTGVVTGYHLHFSLYYNSIKDSKKVPVLKYLLLTDDVTVENKTMKNYDLLKYNEERYVYNVDDEGLNVRNNPDGRLVVDTIKVGTKVNIKDTLGDWIKINDDQWVYGSYLSKTFPQCYMVINAKDGLNVRNKASLNSKVINILNEGDYVAIYKRENKFAKVSRTSKRYVYEQYLKKVIK